MRTDKNSEEKIVFYVNFLHFNKNSIINVKSYRNSIN